MNLCLQQRSFPNNFYQLSYLTAERCIAQEFGFATTVKLGRYV